MPQLDSWLKPIADWTVQTTDSAGQAVKETTTSIVDSPMSPFAAAGMTTKSMESDMKKTGVMAEEVQTLAPSGKFPRPTPTFTTPSLQIVCADLPDMMCVCGSVDVPW